MKNISVDEVLIVCPYLGTKEVRDTRKSKDNGGW